MLLVTWREPAFFRILTKRSNREDIMRILMRNTVFKTVVLAGLFLCVMVGGGAFLGITNSAHATHNEGFIHAEDVGTDQEKLEQFVKDAIDAYYIDFIFRQCEFPENISSLITASGIDFETAPVDQIKDSIPLLTLLPPAVAGDLLTNIGQYCDYSKPFSEVFRSQGAQAGEWESGSIYLFVMDNEGDDQGELLFHGNDETLEGDVLQAFDAGGRNVAKLIVDTAKGDAEKGGFVDYCWNDPATEDDNVGGNDPAIAPGDSWKKVYVVNPFKLLGAPEPAGFSDVIFGSGIYPKTGTPPTGCKIYGGMEEPMEEMEEPIEESMDEPGEMEMPTDTVDSVSGGGVRLHLEAKVRLRALRLICCCCLPCFLPYRSEGA